MKINDLKISTKVYKIDVNRDGFPIICSYFITEIHQKNNHIECQINDKNNTTLIESVEHKGEDLTLRNTKIDRYALYYVDYCDALANAIKRIECKINLCCLEIAESIDYKTNYKVKLYHHKHFNKME